MLSLDRAFLGMTLGLLAACAVGPFVEHESARTVGNLNHEISGGLSSGGQAGQWTYGVSDSVDVGIHAEAYGGGFKFKWAVLPNPERGAAVAVAGGMSFSTGGSAAYGDLIASYAGFGIGEPYLAARITSVTQRLLRLGDQTFGLVAVNVSTPSYLYAQFMAGNRYWLSDQIFFSLEAGRLVAVSGVSITQGYVFSGGIGFRFIGSGPTFRRP